LVVLCTKGKNKGVGQKGGGERDPEKEEREREKGKKNQTLKVQRGEIKRAHMIFFF
jgi:hypothetical protein